MKASNDTLIRMELLNRGRMTRSERLAAEAALAQAERIADALLGVAELLGSARRWMERVLQTPARRKSFN